MLHYTIIIWNFASTSAEIWARSFISIWQAVLACTSTEGVFELLLKSRCFFSVTFLLALIQHQHLYIPCLHEFICLLYVYATYRWTLCPIYSNGIIVLSHASNIALAWPFMQWTNLVPQDSYRLFLRCIPRQNPRLNTRTQGRKMVEEDDMLLSAFLKKVLNPPLKDFEGYGRNDSLKFYVKACHSSLQNVMV